MEVQARADGVVSHKASGDGHSRGLRRRRRDRRVGRVAGVPRPGRNRQRSDVVSHPDRTDERRTRSGGEQRGTHTAGVPAASSTTTAGDGGPTTTGGDGGPTTTAGDGGPAGEPG